MDKDSVRLPIERVIDVVCAYFGIESWKLSARDLTHDTCMARSFAVYILHHDMRYSISELSRRFHRARRTIFLICEQTERYIRMYKDYRSHYTRITDDIHLPD